MQTFSNAPKPAADSDGALLALLQSLTQAAGARGGVLLIQQAERPTVIPFNLPAGGEGQLHDPDSPLLAWAQPAEKEGPWPRKVTSDSLGQVALVPVLYEQTWLGVICLSEPAVDLQAASWLNELGRLAGRLAARPNPATPSPSRRQELDALNKIAAALTSTLELDEILTSTIDGIREILNVEAASLLLLDEERGELIFKKTLGEESDWIFQYSLQTDQGLVSECVREGRPLLVNDVAADPRFLARVDAVTGFETRSILCVPLVARGQTLGAIEIINKRGGLFDGHDLELLGSMTASVANSIYNARLFHQLTVANADLQTRRWEVLRSRNTLRALFDGIPHPIYIVDGGFHLVALNRACTQLPEVTLPAAEASAPAANPAEAVGDRNPFAALIGRVCYEQLYARNEPCDGCRMIETLYTRQSQQRIERRWASDDQVAEWDINTYPIVDEAGQAGQVIVFAQDVTEKRRLESSLAQSEKLAAVGQLAAGVAHEINNPLAAIIANAQLLKRELAPDDDRQESVDLITLAGDRALQVVRNLLNFARQERYELVPTDVNQSLETAFAVAGPLLKTPGLQVICDLAPDLPLISASQDHLQGVWLNFLMNARDALAGGQGDIRVTSRRQANEIHVVIVDTGMGIQPERLSRLFEPFYTTKKPGHGTGLGLFTCHRIIKQHGGHILVDSQVGRGTAFTVALPIPAANAG